MNSHYQFWKTCKHAPPLLNGTRLMRASTHALIRELQYPGRNLLGVAEEVRSVWWQGLTPALII